jgi:hypothetical protein
MYPRSSLFWAVTQRRMVVTGVSEQPICPIFQGLCMPTTNLRCVTSKKSEDLFYTAEEAWNRAERCLHVAVGAAAILFCFEVLCQVSSCSKQERATKWLSKDSQSPDRIFNPWFTEWCWRNVPWECAKHGGRHDQLNDYSYSLPCSYSGQSVMNEILL